MRFDILLTQLAWTEAMTFTLTGIFHQEGPLRKSFLCSNWYFWELHTRLWDPLADGLQAGNEVSARCNLMNEQETGTVITWAISFYAFHLYITSLLCKLSDNVIEFYFEGKLWFDYITIYHSLVHVVITTNVMKGTTGNLMSGFMQRIDGVLSIWHISNMDITFIVNLFRDEHHWNYSKSNQPIA